MASPPATYPGPTGGLTRNAALRPDAEEIAVENELPESPGLLNK